MAFVVEKKEGDVREGEINVVDIMGVRRISPGVYLLKVDENTYAIPPEAGEEISPHAYGAWHRFRKTSGTGQT